MKSLIFNFVNNDDTQATIYPLPLDVGEFKKFFDLKQVTNFSIVEQEKKDYICVYLLVEVSQKGYFVLSDKENFISYADIEGAHLHLRCIGWFKPYTVIICQN